MASVVTDVLNIAVISRSSHNSGEMYLEWLRHDERDSAQSLCFGEIDFPYRGRHNMEFDSFTCIVSWVLCKALLKLDVF